MIRKNLFFVFLCLHVRSFGPKGVHIGQTQKDKRIYKLTVRQLQTPSCFTAGPESVQCRDCKVHCLVASVVQRRHNAFGWVLW